MKSPYNQGYLDGINNRKSNNPYNFGTLYYAEYENGYDEGSTDCDAMEQNEEFF